MNILPEIAIQRYEMIRDEVRIGFPQMWNDVIQLCEAVPDQVESQHVWQMGRDKPCWSNITVGIGEKISADMRHSEDFNSFEVLASDDWEITMLNRGTRWRANKNFELRGQAVRNFVSGLTGVGISSYLWKLYAIRNLAIALQREPQIQLMVNNLHQQGRIPSNELKQWTIKFCKRVGMGWGVVTVYHMLADLGISAKPDMWLNLSAVRMGLLAPKFSSDYPEERMNKVNVHEVVGVVLELAELITPLACPRKPHSVVREVDKVLMEWGRQRLVRPL